MGKLALKSKHRLMCGDAMTDADLSALMAGLDFQLCVLDPPFEMEPEAWSRFISDPCIMFGNVKHMLLVPPELFRWERVILKKYRHRNMATQVDQRHAIIAQLGTVKKTPGDGRTFPSVVDQEVDRKHRHAKPATLIAEHMVEWTADWDIALDPFAGSGSTIIAAEIAGGRCFAMEVLPGFCDIIVRRWEEHTGGKAVLAPVRRDTASS